MQLSPHFSLAEFEHTDTGLPNAVPPALIPSLRALCTKVLEPIRAHFGPVTLNSGYRSPKVNAAVGGAPTSQHAKGQAADIEVASASNLALAQWVRDNLSFDQLILESYKPGKPTSGWVHVSWTEARKPRRSILTMTMGSHGPVYSTGIQG